MKRSGNTHSGWQSQPVPDVTDAHIPRFYINQSLDTSQAIDLNKDQSHHLARVLRALPGDAVILFNGDGCEYRACVAEVSKSTVSLDIQDSQVIQTESALKLTLVQGIARGDRMDNAISKAVELGATAVQPVFTARGKVRLQDDRANKKHAHWQRIATSAAEQSGRGICPEVRTPVDLADFLRDPPTGLGLVLAPQATQALQDVTRAEAVTLLIGPESGLTPQEIEQAESVGYLALRFGPRILRTETAGPACLAALQTLWGDLGSL